VNAATPFLRAGLCAVAAFAAATFAMLVSPAGAMTIEKVVSPGGIEAWLVHDSAVPVIALEFATKGSADQDPADKPGIANMAASLLDEGAGPYDSTAIELSFRAGRDYFRGTLRMLKEHRDEAFEYLRLSLTEPRFDAADVERIRAQIVSRLQRETTNPNDIASRNWWGAAFPGHPYGRPVNGTVESLPRITADDLRAYVRQTLARDHLKIAIVGDIDAATAGRLIDRTFGGLPAKSELTPVARVVPQGSGRRIVIHLDVPQAVVNFGAPGIARSDPDFMAAYIVNHILGGGSFSSRLYREVREKRGLAYGVSDSLVWLNHTSMLLGSTATRADATGQTIEIIEHEIRRLAEEGPTEEEFAKAKTYLKGSFALGLDTSNRIAAQLLQMQLDNLGIDYIARRGGMIDGVTMADAKRVAKRLLDGGLLITVVGRPEGVTSTDGGTGATPANLAKPNSPAATKEP
jgi:zinc protease